MNLDERLRDLCKQGKRTQAESLARAVLTNEPVQEVVIDHPHIYVDTPRFRGSHRLQTDPQGAADIHSRGEYAYKSDSVELSFSTATMSQRAFDRVQESLAVRNGTEPHDYNDEQTLPKDPAPAEPDAAANAAERPTTSPVGFLRGLL